jgi:hypothetical protein
MQINKNKLYQKKDLLIDHRNTLIIIDWDDTLFPTSWTIKNNIDLTSPTSRLEHIHYFEKLDVCLKNSLDKMAELGDIMIITNAMPEWIYLCTSVLPKTKKKLDSIKIISARKIYQNKTKINNWKKHTFANLDFVSSFEQKYKNIISLGDAEYEYEALINLYNHTHVPHKYLKSIKFVKGADFDIIIKQIKIISTNIKKICKSTRHIDLIFHKKNNY